MQHTCKNCGTMVKIPEEWILIGLDERIKCHLCGRKVLLKIEKFAKSGTIPSNVPRKTRSGTVINKNAVSSTKFYRVTLSNSTTGQILVVKKIYSGRIYIVGRNSTKILAYDPSAEPIFIPTAFDGAVSRVHLQIKVKKFSNRTKLVVKDLSSNNGTLILRKNTQELLDPTDEVFIEDDDRLKIGQNTLLSFASANLEGLK